MRVLFIGGTEAGLSPLCARLRRSGGQCQLARSCLEGARLLADGSFDLVLCSVDADGYQALIRAVVRCSASLFRYFPGEVDCWWIPTLVRGERCAGEPALRAAEFADTLNSLMPFRGKQPSSSAS